MVEKVYSHLATLRHRSEVVEYRIEQHAATLGDRLEALRGPYVTQIVTRLCGGIGCGVSQGREVVGRPDYSS
jgi:hypothetical protein